MKKVYYQLAVSASVVLASCSNTEEQMMNPETESLIEVQAPEPVFMDLQSILPKGQTLSKVTYGDYEIEVTMAEYLTTGEESEMGNVVFFSDRGNKQLSNDFSPLLSIDGSDAVSYYIDMNRPSADLDPAITEAAIQRAMNTWDGIICSELGMTRIPSDPGITTGFIAALLGFGGSLAPVAEVTHCGWLPGAFFDAIAPNGSQSILGVAFTLNFTQGGQPVDTNNDGKPDVAFREIYYNDNFTWNNGSTYDVETIALHEAGHGLSQEHFGKAFLSNGNGKLHFSPRAVMNASYSGVQIGITKTDNAGHCSIWGNWPNN